MRNLRGYVVACQDQLVDHYNYQFAQRGGWSSLNFAIIFRTEQEAIRLARRRHPDSHWRVVVLQLWYNVQPESAAGQADGGSYLSVGQEVWPAPNIIDRLGSLDEDAEPWTWNTPLRRR